MINQHKRLYFLLFLLLLLPSSITYAEDLLNNIKHIETDVGSQITIYKSGTSSKKPKIFTTDTPATIAIDFPDTTLGLENNQIAINQNNIKNILAVETQKKSRVIINLKALTPYEYQEKENEFVLTLSNKVLTERMDEQNSNSPSIEKIDFEVKNDGTAQVIVDLSVADIDIDVSQLGNNIHVKLPGVNVPKSLAREIDVSDLNTQVVLLSLPKADDSNPILKIYNKSESDFSTFQTDRRLTLEIAPKTSNESISNKKTKEFTGEKLSLNFQDIEVRAILQLLADFTDKNLVASDSVGGNLTLRLKNVPWDQALDIILKARGLGKREVGNVMMVAPQEELTARERLEMESKQQYLELSPLKTEFIQVNYAKASDMASIIKDEANNLISERGNVSVDERTNTLLVQETSEYLKEIKIILKALDIPVKQVQIESKIVIANDDFSRGLGVKLGYSLRTSPLILDGAKTNNSVIIGGGIGGDTSVATGTGFLNNDNSSTPQENYQVSLPITSPTGALKMFVGR